MYKREDLTCRQSMDTDLAFAALFKWEEL